MQRALDAERQKFDEDTERLIATSNKVRDQSAAVAKARAAAAAERARAQQLRDECAALAAQADADKQVVESVAADIKVRARALFAASTHLTRVGWSRHRQNERKRLAQDRLDLAKERKTANDERSQSTHMMLLQCKRHANGSSGWRSSTGRR